MTGLVAVRCFDTRRADSSIASDARDESLYCQTKCGSCLISCTLEDPQTLSFTRNIVHNNRYRFYKAYTQLYAPYTNGNGKVEYKMKKQGLRSTRLLFSICLNIACLFVVVLGDKSRSKLLKWSTVTCSALGSKVTCRGDGSLTQAIVRKAGIYTKYEIAVIEYGVTRIEAGAFTQCYSLTSVSLPESVVYIGGNAFDGIPAKSITFPSSVTSLSNMVVNCCSEMTHVHMAFQNGTYKSQDGMIMYDTGGYNYLYIVSAGRCKEATLEIPNVDKISSSAVRWNQASIIKVPDSVIEIQSEAFYACSMHTLEIGKGLATMSSSALCSCTALTTITLSSENTNFCYKSTTTSAFFGKLKSGTTNPMSILWVSQNSTSITIPGTVTEIGATALQSCPKLEAVSVESTSTTFSVQCNGTVVASKDGTIAYYAAGGAINVVVNELVKYLRGQCFRELQRLESVKMHSGLIGCGGSCFRCCYNLHTVDFASCTIRSDTSETATQEFAQMIFAECHSLKTILNWPTNNFSFGEAAFFNCAFEELVLPKQLTKTGERVFSYCSKLVSVAIPSACTELGDQTFSCCAQLKSIIFEAGSTLTVISGIAMAYCTSLETITLPDSVTSLGVTCFLGDTSLNSINFEKNTGLYRSHNGGIYESKAGNSYYTFFICPPAVSSFTLNEGTRVIGTRAFHGCSSLTDVFMNGKLERIENEAFSRCNQLAMIRIPSSVTYLGDLAFDHTNLKSVLYCSNNDDINYEGDPFPTNPEIYIFHTFSEGACSFCTHSCQPVLDLECNIPTDYFTLAIEKRIIPRAPVLRLSVSFFAYTF